MCDYDNAIFRLATAQEAEPEDYTGEDGLLYCGSCRQPKEAYFQEGKTFFGRDRHPKECDCQRKRRERTARLPANRSAPARSSGTASHSTQSPTQQLKAAPMENQNRARISPSLFRKRRSRLGLRLKKHDYTF